MISTRFSTLVSLALVFATTAPRARAQNGTAIAEGLFREGKKLLDAKKFSEACPKFEESARLDPSSGVELALGICYEGLGKTASAWGAYQTAVSLARRDNRRDRERAASAHAAALEPKLAHATIDVPTNVAQLGGLQVKEDGVVIGAAAWKDAPIDPGSHALEVSATGKKTWTTTFVVDAGTKSVSVPMLEEDPNAQPQNVTVTPPPAPTNPFRIAAVGTLAGGAAFAIAASILGGIAISDKNDASKTCTPPKCADANAVSENNSAGTMADWSTALFIVAGAAAATSVVLFFLHPAPSTSSSWHVGVHPIFSPTYLGVRGVF